MKNVMYASVALFFLVLALKAGADLAAHYSRYRKHLRDYPATKRMRGKVWRGV